MHLMVFAHNTLKTAIHNVSHNVIKTGLKGVCGNKGGVGITMNIGEKKYLFINCHL